MMGVVVRWRWSRDDLEHDENGFPQVHAELGGSYFTDDNYPYNAVGYVSTDYATYGARTVNSKKVLDVVPSDGYRFSQSMYPAVAAPELFADGWEQMYAFGIDVLGTNAQGLAFHVFDDGPLFNYYYMDWHVTDAASGSKLAVLCYIQAAIDAGHGYYTMLLSDITVTPGAHVIGYRIEKDAAPRFFYDGDEITFTLAVGDAPTELEEAFPPAWWGSMPQSDLTSIYTYVGAAGDDFGQWTNLFPAHGVGTTIDSIDGFEYEVSLHTLLDEPTRTAYVDEVLAGISEAACIDLATADTTTIVLAAADTTTVTIDATTITAAITITAADTTTATITPTDTTTITITVEDC